MADVTGSIGNESVELNNAATEATLKMLLQATLAAAKGSKEELNKIAAMAAKAGLDSDSIEKTNVEVAKVAPQMNALGKASFILGATFGQVEGILKTVWNTGQLLASGNAQASSVLTNMATMLPGPLGAVTKGLAALASFQEKMLEQYQTVTRAGVNFGGSLTDLRLAASKTYMTMDEFSRIVSTNGPVFAKMGGTADQGARAFVKASNELLSSDAGTKLRALGYTAEEVNQGMLNYISITGGRNRKEMQDSEALAKSTTVYLQELDQLSAITGKNRQEQEKKLKEEMEEAEFQLFLASKSKEERELIEQNVKRATVLYGKGGADIAKASAMGVAVQGEAGKKLTAVSSRTAQSIQDDLNLRRKYGAQSEQVIQNEIKGRKANAEDIGRLAGPVGSFSGVLKGNEDAVRQAARDRVAGEKEVEDQYSQAAKERAERERSQAEAAVKTKQSLDELGQKLLAAFAPVIDVGLKLVNAIGPLAPYIIGVIAAFKVLQAGMIAYDLAMKARAVAAAAGGGAGGVAAAGASLLRGGAAPAAPAGGALAGAAGAAGKAGGGILAGLGPALRGAASGLMAFANPLVIAGAAGFGLAIAAIGAGLAGAAWLMGKALPTLAEGFGKFTEIDGAKLGASAFGIGKLGIGLIPFAPMAIWGLPVGFALNLMGDGLQKIAAVDPARLEKVAAGMEKVKAATPTIGESIRAGVAGLVSKVVGTSDAASAPTTKPKESGEGTNIINLVNEVKRLNSISAETLKYIKETAEYTRRTVDATKNLNGNLFT